MVATRIRTAILTLATLAVMFSVGFASGPIAHDASAAPNTGKYQRSVEALKKKILCDGLQESMREHVENALYWTEAESVFAPTDSLRDAQNAVDADRAAEREDKAATEVLNDARMVGCGWAQA